jgi:hypothetical protein
MKEKFRKLTANCILFGFLGTVAFTSVVAFGMVIKEIIVPLLHKAALNPYEYISYFVVSLVTLGMVSSMLVWAVKNRKSNEQPSTNSNMG